MEPTDHPRPDSPKAGRARNSDLSKILLERRRKDRPSNRIPRRAPGALTPLSYAQEQIWFLEQLAPDGAAYHIARSFALEGPLDPAALARSLGAVVARHEALRTSFAIVEGQPVQAVAAELALAIPVLDLRAVPAPAREEEARRLEREEVLRPFDLARGPVLRLTLLRLADERSVLLLTLHHIAADGWSLGILLRELGALYAGETLPPLPLQYADFALWQRERLAGSVLEKLLAFWRTQLEGAPPVLALPTDRPRPAIQSFRGAGVRRVLRRELAARLRSFGERERASPFMALLAAFQALLVRHTGQEDLVVGSPVSGRSRSELEGLIGLFINMLVLRTSLASDPGFRELTGRVRAVTLSAYEHQEMPFEKLVTELSPERDLGHAPVFQVIFTLQSAAWERLDLPGIELAPREIKREETKVDLTFAIHETGDGLALALQYDRDLFDGTTMARLAAQYEELLSAALAEPDRPVSGLPALLPAERHQVFHEWNDTGAAYPYDRALPAVFAEQVERSPAEVALICGDVCLTFRELGEQSDRLAHHLQLLGVGPEDLVALCLERSPDLIVGLLGILKAGAAYVPLDPESPSERLAWILADTGARLLVTEERLSGLLPDPSVRRVLLDGDRALIAQRGADPLPNLSGPESLAYVMYTSGSSGRPKGVAVPHRAVARLVRGPSYATFAPGEVFLQLAPVSFDASTFEIWGSLLNGARLVVFPPRKPTLAELEEEIARHGVSTLWLTAGLFHVMLDERPQAFARVRQMLAGGDVLSPIQSRKFLAVALPGARLINGYGPTEGTTFTCCNPVSDSAAVHSSFPIGRPIANTRVYLLDGTMTAVPLCVAGELFIGGDGLARGYWNRPDLTAEKFVPDPFGGQPGARLYRSGDLARWLPDGTVDFLGRIDQQVKIRGFRVEPGEIEASLLAEPEVREAAVVVRQEAGDRRLVAYIVGTNADLKERLRARLPEYMVPAAIVALEALPLLPSGKVDRGALAKLGVLWAAAPEQGHVAPRTALEGELAGMWSSSLGLEKVGIHDNFFELGGNSITGAVLINRLQERLGETVHVAAIFDEPTIAGLAAWLGSRSPEAVERIWGIAPAQWDGASPPPAIPLSFAQERLWFLDQLEPGNPFYNIPAALRLEGALDAAALQRSFDQAVRRHRVLRTRFALVEGAPVQVAAPDLRVPLPVVDLGALPRALREAETQRLANAEARRPFDLSQGPLIRTTLLRQESEAHALLLSMHHIVSDGWSLGVLLQELAALYESSPLPELPIQYADYAVWQRGRLAGEALEAELAWWRERLAGVPALLELPTDRPRPPVQSFRGGKVEIALPAALSERLAALSRKSGATLFMALLAGFDALLSRLTGQLDVVVGSPVAGRNRAELEGLIGFFVNTLVLRTDLSGDPGFAQVLERIRQTTVGAYAHQEVPFEKLVAELAPVRTLAHAPLFQVMLILQNAPWRDLRLGDLALTWLGVEAGTSKFDLRLSLMEGEEGLAGSIVYNRDLFDNSTVTRFAAGFHRLLAGALADPGAPLPELPLLDEAERHQLLREWNDTGAAFRRNTCLHELIARQAARTPDAPALVFEGESLTYAEVDRRANHLAWRLRELGVGPEVRVAVAVERSLELPLALLAVLKAGGAYVPLDPSYPQERLAYMLEDSRAAVQLTRERVLELSGESDEAPDSGVRTENLAYVIYTSGSTGRPKGAMNSHRGIVNRLRWMQSAYGLDSSDRVLQKTPASFDVSVWEFFWPLLTGACLVLAKPGGHQDSAYLVDLIQRERVTTMHFVPSMLQVFVEQRGVEECTSLKRVICSGEALPMDLVRRYFERMGAELHNLYGPTEAAVDVTYWACRRDDRTVPIGRPIANLSIQIVDRSLHLVPLGVPGELLIGGAGVGRGYLDRPDLTAERFVPGEGERLYRTGDLARFLGDGRIEYLGRIDHQVKVRGFRIELQEIEAALMAEPEVREAAVVVREEASDRRLVAYVVSTVGTDADLKERLRARLPDYMVPAAIVALEALPLSPSGKVDRGALAKLGVLWTAAPEQGYVAPRTALESELAGMWSTSLGLDKIGVHDNFFELGGNSITGAILINRLQERLGEIVHVVAIFDAPTVAGLAAWLSSHCPEAVERLWGPGSLRGEAVGEAHRLVLGPAAAAAFRKLIEPLAPAVFSGKSPRAVFLLSPPRSGSTLLRVMLAGHPSLFAPPELELLSFNTMAERRAAFSGRDSFWLEGAIRAVMEIQGEGPKKAREWIDRSERNGWTTHRFYREIQELLGGRMLVDKTPSYALDPSVLQRAEEGFDGPLYIHLLRHPYGMISSFEEAKLDQVFFRRAHPFGRRELAELVWRVSHENVTAFLAGIPAERHRAVYFEDLVREPEVTLRALCGFLGLDFDPAMAAPYQDKGRRMTDGLYAESRMLGDVKFHQHQGVEASTAERWRERYREDFLAPETWVVAAAFGYERPAHGLQPIAPAEWDGASPLPLSFAQERLWFLDQLEPDSSFYNIPAMVRLQGVLHAAALQEAFNAIVRRHRTLRTRFAAVQGEPAQVVEPELCRPLPVVDLADLPAVLRETETRHLANAEARRPFDLSQVPLLRTMLLRLGKEEHALLLCMHHIVSDGWSMGLLFQELASLYEGSPLPELPIQFADFAVWQRGRLAGEALEQELAWWRERLAGAPGLLELPTDRPRPAVQSFRGGRVELALPRSSEIAALSRRSGTTLFMTLLAAFDALLSRLTGQLDVVVGSPITGRNRTELEGLIGFFVNTLVLRTDLSGDPGFDGILERVRQATIGAYIHQELPFEKLVGELAPVRTLAHAPLFQVMLVLQNLPRRELRIGGALGSVMPAEERTAKFDLTLGLVERGAGLAGAFQFNSDLFDAATITRFADHFRTLVEGAVANPAVRLSELPLLSAAARAQLLREWNDTAVSIASIASIAGIRSLPEQIAQQAARTPEAVAVLCGDASLTYAALDRRANWLAWHLQSLGVGPETRVAIAMERSPDLLVALLGVLKAGGAYVPIDPSYPEERRAYMLADSGAAVVLDGSLPASEGEGETEAPPLVLAPGNLAYVLYTSGSTGRPKGVQVPHGALVNFLDSMRREPGLDGTDTLLAVTTLSFDIAGLELFLPLLVGARVVLAGREEAQEGARLAALLESSGATVLQATPATWQMLLDSGWPGSPRLRAFCGGEALPRDLAERLLPRTAALWNLYGPTEATIWCSAERVLPGEGRISVGRPIANTCLHVLDADLGLAPLGAVGELAIGGGGLARGYAGRSDLTAERFVPDPFSSFGQGERLYRTGDLARALPDGRLEVLGRIDHQVKVRGFRIELQEIEAALARHPDLREAVVLARAGRLVAFVVATVGSEVGSAALRSFVGGILPEYMVPSLVIPLPAFPLTPNGKVDRKALAALSTPVFSKETAAPRSPVEEVAVEIWRAVLKVSAVGIDDDFFELGGHSLLATQVMSRVREAFGVDLGVRSLFEAKTLSAWAGQVARALRAGRGTMASPIEPAVSLIGDGASPLPLSFAQERLWFLDQLEPGSSFYNIPAVIRLEGALDPAALREAFNGIVRRHRILRTRFTAVQSEPAQIVEPELCLPLPIVDLAGLPAALRETETRFLANTEARRPFDLSRVPLLRTTLLRLGKEEHALLLCMHHIVSDGWSMGILFQELATLYERSPLPELPIQYADFAIWQRGRLAGEVLEAELAWWRERLTGAPALLELPTDRPRPAVQSFRGGKIEVALPLSEEIAALSRRSGTTLFMTLLAAFDALLSRLSGQPDVVVGSPIAGRDRTELEGLIGFFINTLVLRTDLSGDPSFNQILERVRQATIGAYTHQELPFEKLVGELAPVRTLAHAPLFQVMLVLQNVPRRGLRIGNLALTQIGVEAGTSKFDLRLSLTEREDGLLGSVLYNRDLFDGSTAARFTAGFGRLLAGALVDPAAPLSELPLLDEAERHQLLREWNDTGTAYGPAGCLHELIAQQAARTPEAPALVFEGESLTYAELERRANHLAWRLREMGVGPEVRVAVEVERSLELPLALLAVLKAGGAYVPLDPSYPRERLDYMLADSRAAVRLTREQVIPGERAEAPDSGVQPDNLAYVIYTSGSTGRPKGAMNSHRGIVNRLQWMQSAYGLDCSDRVLQKTPASFDVSVWEFFWPLLTGACLVVAKPGGHQDSAYLVDLIRRERVTTLHFVPSMLQVFVEQPGVEQCTSLKRVICSGEALPADLVRRYFERLEAGLYNLYGPTEAAVDVTYQACRREDRVVPIGRPIANLSIEIVDRAFRPAPLGVPGELLIGGVGMGRGYLDRPDLTAERFIPGPSGERLYRTGDLARHLGDGRIEYLGRIDHQVKVRGFRIELQEIEAALMAEPEVREAAVVVRHEASDQAGDRRLVAYVVGAEADLQERLRARLPEYMVPAAILFLEALPLSPSGKVDRGALSKLGVLRFSAPEHVAPRTALEDELARMWSASLGLEQVGVHDNFFELGGNSITGAILINRLQERLGEIVHVVAIFDAPTVAGLATWLGSQCPEAVERIWGSGSLPGGASLEQRRVLGPAEVAAFRELIEPLAPTVLSGKNPRAVFLLSPPRSGSTLLRVMLAGHPSLFAPPELELLTFNTMAERREAFSGRDSFWLEGAIRGVMEIQGEGPHAADTAREWIERSEQEGWTTQRFYREIQELLGERMLVDKTPSYALDPSVLQRAEESFEEPLYIHLLRHPYGMISSFEEAKLDQVFFRRPHSYARRELAELVWRVSHENVTEFLAGIPAERHHAVYFEDLVREPEATLRDLCEFLCLDFDPAMAAPYQGERMTDGLYAESRMLGDVKFHQHQGVEASAAERWRERYREDFLAPETWAVATAFGYEERPSHAFQPIAPAEWDGVSPLPLSFAQERLWFLDQLEPGNPFYNIPLAVRLDGALDVAALRRSFDGIVRRHRVLRTRFTSVQGEPAQVVLPEVSLPLPIVDLSVLPEDLREEETRRLANAEARLPFDLVQGPLIRTTLLRLGSESHGLLLSMHHIVSDGWSVGVLLQELSQTSALPELPIQYADFAVWQRARLSGKVLEAELAWWRERLAGAPALLELPTDRPRPAVQSFRGGKIGVVLPLSEEIAALSRRSGATLFMALLAAFDALLSRLSGQLDMVVGSPIAGRDRTELEGLIGFFINTLVLRTDLSGDPGFAQILERIRECAVGAYAHQELPFEKLVGELAPVRTLAHAPLFQVMLMLQNAPRRGLRIGDARASAFAAEGATAKFDLTLSLAERGGSLAGTFQYNSDLFDAATIARFADHFRTLIESAVADPAARLSDLPLFSATARAQLLREWNDTAADPGGFRSLPERIDEQAARTPEAVAVLCGDASLTYAALERRANRLARHLRDLGVGPETRVAIAMERSPDLLVALLGVLKAGGAYVPIDPSYPEERRAYMLADSGAAVVLDGSLPASEGEGETEAPPLVLAPGNLAYVLYTSGSTGQPKGVQVPHGALVNFLDSMRREPGLDGTDTLLAVTTLSFDIAGLELFLPLLVGARVVLASREEAQDGARLAALLESSGATLLQATPATWQMLLDLGWPGNPRLRAFCGGEALPRDLAERLLPRTAALWNLYGPTEATIWCSAERVLPGEGRISIGRPIANTRLHVLDADLGLAPLGAVGELAIGGEGLARGYVGRSDLTAERFVPDPFGRGERLYRTGDLSRVLPDGRLEVLGRIDHQVKVRGFRIELQEIEAALARHPDVRETVVLARDGRLVAFAVATAGSEVSSAALRSFAAGFLPEYMVPSFVVPLPAFPLTPNGKVDRKALAALSTPVFPGKEAAAPRSPVEEIAVEIWREILKVPAVGIDDDFFELGGHSLLATQVVSRAREAFGIELPVRSLFEAKTLSAWAGQVDRALRAGKGAAAAPIKPMAWDGASPLPLSFAQERLWFLDQLEPGSSFYNIPAVVRLEGALDTAALRQAFDGIVHRHQALRTRFAAVRDEPAQIVEPALSLPLPVVELAGLPAALRETEARRLASEEARRPFDLSRVPLLRTTLIRLGNEEHALLLCLHHIVSDGWSMGLLFQELSALYEQSPLPELPVQYTDFAVWQRARLAGEALERELAWWREGLAGAPALLELPTDRPRPAIQSFRGGRVEVALPALPRRSGTTLFMTLLAAFDALLSRLTGQLDVVVGTPVAGRDRTEIEGLIGFFVNTLVLRADLSGDPGFGQILERVREGTLGAYAHQELPFEKLVGELAPVRTLAHAPLFQVMLMLQNLPRRELRIGGVRTEGRPPEGRTAKFDLTLSLAERGDGFAGAFQYNSDLFDAATIARWAEGFRILVEGVMADPGARLSDLPLLSAAARAQLLREWNDTAFSIAGIGGFRSLPERIAGQAARTPEAVALLCGGESLTYAELNRRANRLAWHLRSLGVGPEVRVAITMERSPDLLVALLGVLKAGGAYVPIDPSYPEERRAWMLADSGAMVLDGSLVEGDAEAPPLILAPENLAYVLYTSGSTGRPKGVQVPHGALVSFLDSMRREPGLDGTDTLLAVTTLSFDIAGLELFLPLLVGARVVLAGREDAQDAARLGALIESSGATVLQATPATWQMLLDSGWEGSPRLRAFCGGEALPRDLAERLLPRTAALWNLYGPTEATIWCSAERVLPGERRISIGRPIANTRLHVLDADLNLAPLGVTGELVIGGEGLARGYSGRSDLTAERFVPDPFGRSERLYRTGDLARVLPDGRLEVLGRIDHQVKVRGFRIELQEIEEVLARHSDVREAVVLATEGRLVAFVVANAGREADLAAVRSSVREILPEYMVPSLVVALPAFPLTSNGKVDRKALAGLSTPVFSKEAAAPRSPVEEIAVEIWREVLKVPAVGIDDDFFELGGHSLLATQVVSRAREAFGIELPVRSLFEAKTLSAWAGQVDRALRAGKGAAAAPIKPMAWDGASPLPLSFAQERLWFLDQLEPGSSFYNIPAAVRLEGALDAAALRQAFDGIVRRHQALRTRFAAVRDEPAQIVEPALSLPLPVVDLAALPAVGRAAEARRLADDEARRPFDLSRVPLLRTTLIRLGNEEHAMLLCLHHIVSDGWSMGLLFQELSALYERSFLPELPIQYADFGIWQRERLAGEVLESELAWWRERLAGAPALLELPTDRPRPAAQSFRGGRVEVALPRSAEIAALSRRSGATLFMTLLAAFDALLSRLTGQLDVVVGSPVAGRDRTEIEGLIGFFVNTLVLRTDLSGDPGFAGILERVRQAAIGAYTHQELPFEKLVGELAPVRTLAHAPLFQVMLTLQNLPRRELRLGGARADVMSAEGRTAKFDLTLSLAERGGSLAGGFQYNSDLFDASTVARFADGFRILVEGAVADPSARLSDLPLLSAAGRAQLLSEWNDTAFSIAGIGGFRSLPERIAEQAARTPEAVALLCGDESLTYAELNRRANRLAWHLRSLGVGSEVRVAISMERSPDLLVALLGVLKAGGAYVPVDPSYPEERRAYMLADSGAALVLDGSLMEGEADAPPPLALAAGNLAYVLYTSGSTGRPKGVQVPHGALVNFLDSMRREPGLDGTDTLLAVTTLSFDIAGLELLLPLLVGARVVLAGHEDAQDAARLGALLESSGATVLQATPATWQMLLDSGWQGSSRLRALCGGEALPRDLADRLLPRVAALWNLYGPTEATIWCSAERVLPGEGRISIGRPIANTRLHVLDADLGLAPLGAVGELAIGGEGLARGYAGRGDLTAERFVPDPFGSFGQGERLYRTGDLARALPDRRLEVLGRIDHQVKVRGFRIELQEIEAALARHPDVREAVVLATDGRLAAFVVANAGREADPAAVRSSVREILPEYMVPSLVVALPSFPLTPNGKVDRKALPAPEPPHGNESAFVAPSTEMEELVARVWAQVLGIERVGAHDRFFDIGGQSLLATQVVSRLRRELGLEIPLRTLFERPTLAGFSYALEDLLLEGTA